MKPEPRFKNLNKAFWANVRTISETGGYTVPRESRVKSHTLKEMQAAMIAVGLQTGHLATSDDKPTEFARTLEAYLSYRAEILNSVVKSHLMNAERARAVYEEIKARFNPMRPVPMNKQKKEKRVSAYLTGIVNGIVEAHIGGLECQYDPQKLTTFTRDGAPLRTLGRRVDGCFSHIVNPVALWEIKEYYYTTTFGSRIADGVYETLLDGMELEELREHEGIEAQHLLVVDAYDTWWSSGGRPYLCRIIDMLHMGYVDEVLFGYETVERLPELVREWVEMYYAREAGVMQ
ncbi:MAG: hypothetical protein M3Y58_20700 [Chloroflexota bacterium]|nr:hypothetical protein [Chloroflexota bacterium]